MMGSLDPNRARRRARIVVLAAVIVTAVLYLVPYGRLVAYPLLLLSTLVHEMGHGLAAVLVGGEFDSFRMYVDGSGVAMAKGNFSRLASGFISAGGLVGPAILGAVFFALSSRERAARLGLFLFGGAMAVSCFWVVEGLFGWIFVGLVAAMSLLVAYKGSAAVSQAVVALLASQLALSVFSRGDYLFTDTAVTENGASTQPSDVANMAQALFLPYWFWGAVCGLFSVAVLAAGLWLFWRATRNESGRLEMASE